MVAPTSSQVPNLLALKHPLSHLPSLRESPLIVVGERERTGALHGEILYPSTSSAASSAFARASVSMPQVTTSCEFPSPSFSLPPCKSLCVSACVHEKNHMCYNYLMDGYLIYYMGIGIL